MTWRIEQYPVIVDQDVTWGDMDAHGHVNNVVYLRYMENARVEFYRRIGKYEFEERSGITLVIQSVHCRYIAPLAYPDRIRVGARVSKIESDRMVMSYLVVNGDTGKPAAVGDATIVALTIKDKSRAPFPDYLKQRIVELDRTAAVGKRPGEEPS